MVETPTGLEYLHKPFPDKCHFRESRCDWRFPLTFQAQPAQPSMVSFRPRSILQLTLLGFLAVTGLLIVALVVTTRELDGLSTRSQEAVNLSALAMTASRELVEQSSSMERNARQYAIVGNDEILQVYDDRRSRFDEAVRQLRSMQLGEEMRSMLDEMAGHEGEAHEAMLAENLQDEGLDHFGQMRETAYRISEQVNRWTGTQVADIRRETGETKALLTAHAVLFVSAALLLSGIFTVLITRPLGQMERAIGGLGAGEYGTRIRISGPRDLRRLGRRLDWLRSRLERLEKQRSSFLRHVSHELKTPLAALQESASLLSDGVVGELTSQQRDILDIQRNNCKRLQALIDDLLRYNAESFSVLNAMPEPVRLDRVVREVVNSHELVVRSSSLTIKSDLEKVTVLGDREQFRVVVDNLLTNAIKFSPDHGVIDLTLRMTANEALLDVRDRGAGVPVNEAEKIFEAFYQGSTPGRAAFKGSGLGLAIVQEYVEANGGSIAVLEAAVGAHFRVRYPLAEQTS